MKKILLIITHADDDAERANLALAFAATMIALEIDLAIVFMFKGVLLARKGGIEAIAGQNIAPGRDLLPIILESKTPLMACTPSTLTHGVKEKDLLDGCQLISAIDVVPEMAEREVISF